MKAAGKEVEPERSRAEEDLSGLLRPGVLVVEGTIYGLASADPRAMELLGWGEGSALEGSWQELRAALAGSGAFGGQDAWTVLDVPGPQDGVRRLAFDWRAHGAGGVLLIHDPAVTDSLAADLRHAALLRSVSQITPAVAHDLRAPINAMVFNIEVLKETISAVTDAGDTVLRARQLRYVEVLREELHRLHQGLEGYIAQISPRGDREEVLDLREPVGELAALLVGPARKQQARIAALLPDARVPVSGNRFLIRQALLHVAVAALATVPRDGALEIRLEKRKRRARLSFSGGAGGNGEESPGFGIAASQRGTEARLWAARSILAGLGGEVRALAATSEVPASYEIDLNLTQESGSREKE